MKSVKKPVLIAASLAAFGLGAFGVSSAFAAETASPARPFDRLVTAIATKFHLNETDVQAVFTEARQTMMAEREQHMENRLRDKLESLVQDGTLTAAQSAAIQAKSEELKTLRDTLKDKTPQERRQIMDEKIQSLKTWAEEQGIPSNVFPLAQGFFGKGHGEGSGEMMGRMRVHGRMMEEQNQQ